MKNIFLTALVIVCSCSGSNEPDDLIGREQMVKVMTEVHLLEAKINKVPVAPVDSTQAVYDHYEKLLFKDLGITQDQYERSFNYYVDNPNEFEKIYSAVVDSLMEKEKRFKK
ncbi:DUF4296 domain-containing protein [Ekhidna sp. To15]|uniref:DUF4296 domain-containing protein n=1 Tax=Ekhidna sp. To15 TaxID=3395267 RepID=UPI003F524DC7